MRTARRGWRARAWRAAAAVAVLLAAHGPARAFYWHGWPGSRVPPPQTLIPPTHVDVPGNPPVIVTPPPPGGGHIPTPPVGPPVPVDQPPPPPGGGGTAPGGPPGPNSTPEPATGLLGLLGLGALALRRLRTRKS